MESQSFVYDALDIETDEIRLLALQPCISSDPFDQIRCNLFSVKLSAKPKYEALSYMWGEIEKAGTVFVDNKEFVVGANLRLALFHLRERDAPRILWIDAICINQNDNSERGHQVRQMSNIYNQAYQVLVWLGPETEHTTNTFEFLETISGGFNPNGTAIYFKVRKPRFQPRWKSVEELYEIAYWRRLWIIQEVVLAREILILQGSKAIHWTKFLGVLDMIKVHRDTVGFYAKNWSVNMHLEDTIPAKLAQRRLDRTDSHSTEVPLVELIMTFQGTECKDPRDKIIGLLSLAMQCCRESTPIDYSKSYFQLCNMIFNHYINCHVTAMQTFHGYRYGQYSGNTFDDYAVGCEIAVDESIRFESRERFAFDNCNTKIMQLRLDMYSEIPENSETSETTLRTIIYTGPEETYIVLPSAKGFERDPLRKWEAVHEWNHRLQNWDSFKESRHFYYNCWGEEWLDKFYDHRDSKPREVMRKGWDELRRKHMASYSTSYMIARLRHFLARSMAMGTNARYLSTGLKLFLADDGVFEYIPSAVQAGDQICKFNSGEDLLIMRQETVHTRTIIARSRHRLNWSKLEMETHLYTFHPHLEFVVRP